MDVAIQTIQIAVAWNDACNQWCCISREITFISFNPPTSDVLLIFVSLWKTYQFKFAQNLGIRSIVGAVWRMPCGNEFSVETRTRKHFVGAEREWNRDTLNRWIFDSASETCRWNVWMCKCDDFMLEYNNDKGLKCNFCMRLHEARILCTTTINEQINSNFVRLMSLVSEAKQLPKAGWARVNELILCERREKEPKKEF